MPCPKSRRLGRRSRRHLPSTRYPLTLACQTCFTNFGQVSGPLVPSDVMSMALEIGKLREQVDRLREDKGSLVAANEAATKLLADLQRELRRTEIERNQVVEEFRIATTAFERQASELEELRERHSKAQTTIKVQSEQISAPKTPQSRPSLSRAGIFETPPPAINLPQPAPPRMRIAASPFHPPAPAQHRPSTIQTEPSPESTRIERQVALSGPVAVASYSVWSGHDHGALVLRTREAPTVNLYVLRSQTPAALFVHKLIVLIRLSEFANFFRLVEQFALDYANIPDKERDSIMPDSLRNAIVDQTNEEDWMKLLSTSRTRGFAVAKLLNYQIVNSAFRPIIVKDFRAEYDARMHSLRGSYSTGMRLDVRRDILEASSQLVKEMMADRSWQGFVDNLIRKYTRQTWQYVQPLFTSDIRQDKAGADLFQIWSEAVRIGMLMLRKVSMFNADFPPTGPSSIFNPGQMVNRDQVFNQDPMQLGAMNVKVKLAITPVITETDFHVNTPMPKIVHYSNVLLQY